MDLDALHDRAGALHVSGEFAAAEPLFRKVLARDPSRAISRHGLGLSLLSQGRYAEGFACNQARHCIPVLNAPKPSLPYQEWKGEPVHGKRIVIWPEQGFGDQIMHARFAKLLHRLGADVTLLCRPSLASLLAASLPVRVLAATGNVEFPDPDYWVMTCDLAWRCGMTPDTIPGEPYLFAEAPMTGGIGVVTQGNPGHRNDAARSIPEPEASRLLGLPGAMSLAPEETGAQDFLETARIVAGLDLVVTVDTAVAHLAGAMGKPVWVLLPRVGVDWRWCSGQGARWYPSAKVIQNEGSWSDTIDRLAAQLT